VLFYESVAQNNLCFEGLPDPKAEYDRIKNNIEADRAALTVMKKRWTNV
jgi:hypothetical protein